MPKNDQRTLMVDDEAALSDLVEAVSAASTVGIDTEFVRERTYFPKLCLIQVATDELDACVDCLAGLDLEPLLASLLRPDCTWVLHSARQDLEVIWHLAERLPARLVDTQVAAALIGYAPQLGLQELASELLGLHLDKSLTRTDWTRRPLPPAALEYALDDVRHLLPLAAALRDRLEELGRFAWFEEDAARLLSEPPLADPVALWQRFGALGTMTTREQCATLSLVQWREHQAQRLDRPRRWILSDESLLRIARALPMDRDALAAVGDLPRRLVDKSGPAIVAAIERSASEALEARVAAASPSKKPNPSEVKALQAIVKQRAGELDIHAEVLASRRDLVALLTGTAPPALSSGWRAQELELATAAS